MLFFDKIDKTKLNLKLSVVSLSIIFVKLHKTLTIHTIFYL